MCTDTLVNKKECVVANYPGAEQYTRIPKHQGEFWCTALQHWKLSGVIREFNTETSLATIDKKGEDVTRSGNGNIFRFPSTIVEEGLVERSEIIVYNNWLLSVFTKYRNYSYRKGTHCRFLRWATAACIKPERDGHRRLIQCISHLIKYWNAYTIVSDTQEEPVIGRQAPQEINRRG